MFSAAIFLAIDNPGVKCGTDILLWLPRSVRESLVGLGFESLRDRIFSPRVELDIGSGETLYVFGFVHVAGPPFVDFSPMGANRRQDGPSMQCFLIWAGAIHDHRPALVIVEHVPRFLVSLLRAVLGDIYDIDCIVLEAASLGSPARRVRFDVATGACS